MTESTLEDHGSLDHLREQITAVRRQVGRQQNELAEALGFDERALSRKLRGSGRDQLTHAAVKRITKTLAA